MVDTVAGLVIKVSDKGVETAASKLDKVTRSAGSAETATSKLSSSFGALRGVIATLGLAALGRELVNTASQLQNINLRMERLSGSTEAFRNNQQFLLQTSRELNKDYLTLADSYSKILILQDSGLTTQEESRKLLVGMADAAAALGASNNQLELSLNGLSQALDNDIVQTEDFNQIVGNLPGLMGKLNATVAESGQSFKSLVKDQKVTSEFMKTKLIEALGSFEGAAKSANNTISAQFANVQNSFTELAAALETPISDGIQPVLSGIADGIRGVVDNKDVILGFFDAYIDKFTATSNEAITMRDVVGESFKLSAVLGEHAAKLITDAFVQFPENINAIVKLATVELAHLIDASGAVGKGAVEAITVEFAGLVDKAGAYGKALADAINPWADSGFDLDAELARIDENVNGLQAAYFAQAEAIVSSSNEARQASIADIIAVREAATAAFDERMAQLQTESEVKKAVAASAAVAITETTGGEQPNSATGQFLDYDELNAELFTQLNAEEQAIRDSLNKRLEMIQKYEEDKRITLEESNNLQMDAYRVYHEDLENLEKTQQQLRALQQLRGFKEIAGAFATQSKKAMKVYQGIAIVEGIISIAGGVAKALNNPYPANLGFAAQVAAQGAGLLATIKGADKGRGGGGSFSASSSGGATGASSNFSAASTFGIQQEQKQEQQRQVTIELKNKFQRDTLLEFSEQLKENSRLLGIDTIEIVEVV